MKHNVVFEWKEAVMEKNNKLAETVKGYLDKAGIGYSVRNNNVWTELVITEVKERLFIRCNNSNVIRRIRVHAWLDIDPLIVQERKRRLYEACDITSKMFCLNATVYDDGVDIRYDIPDCCNRVLEDLLTEVLYCFHQIDYTLFEKALYSDSDLYEYTEEKRKVLER